MRVEELPSFKKAFDHMPLKAQLLQAQVTLAEAKRELGFLSVFGFVRSVMKKKSELRAQYGDVVVTRFADVPASGISELYWLTAMYLALSEREDSDRAYAFLERIFHRIGPTAHASFYDLNRLKQCEGDIFTNFCKLNRAMWENSVKKGYYAVDQIRDSEDLQYIRVTKCLNVDAFSTLGCPELAKLGCEGDRAGYAPEAIGDEVDLDFRRPVTIAKGGRECEFYYYRKGHAPPEMATL